MPSRSQSWATYRAKYVGSPPLALRRIDREDGPSVTSHARSQKSERVERARVNVDTCIGRMVQHTFPPSCQRVRYEGGQATKTLATLRGLMQEALAKGQGIVKGASKSIAPLTSRARYQQSTGRDPWRCPPWNAERGRWEDMAPAIWRDL